MPMVPIFATPIGAIDADAGKPIVVPHRIFAARRRTFRCTMSGQPSHGEAMDALFETLPLAENDWQRDTISLRRMVVLPGCSVWQVTRT